MADEAQNTAVATEAPAEAQATEQPSPEQLVEQQTPEPQAPEAATSAEIRRKAREAAQARYKRPDPAPEPAEGGETAGTKVDARGRSHDPATGKYLPEQGEPATPQAESQTETAPTAEPSSEQAQPDATATPEVPEGYVRVEVPEAFQRNFGREQVVPKAAEELIRWSFNNPVRNREIEALRGEVAQARAEAAKARAEAEVYRDPAGDPLTDPVVRQKYTEILQAFGEEDAQAYLRGQDKRGEAAQARAAELEQKTRLRAAANEFNAGLVPRAAKLLPAWARYGQDVLRYKLAPHLQRFGARVDRGEVEPDVGKFLDEVIEHYGREPDVQAWYRAANAAAQEKEKERIATEARLKAEQEAKEREEAKLREAAERRQMQHPMGRIPSQVRTDRQTGSTEEPAFDPTGKSADQIKKEMKRRALARVG